VVATETSVGLITHDDMISPSSSLPTSTTSSLLAITSPARKARLDELTKKEEARLYVGVPDLKGKRDQ
jgi:hypothetical protein